MTTPPINGSDDSADVSQIAFQQRFNSVLEQTKRFQGKWETTEPEGEDLEQVNRTAVLNMERDHTLSVTKASKIVDGVIKGEISKHDARTQTDKILSELAGFEAFVGDLDLPGFTPEEKSKTIQRVQTIQQGITNNLLKVSADK